MASFAPLSDSSTGTLKVAGAGGAHHTFSEEEKSAFSAHINQCMSFAPEMARHLPLQDDLFDHVNDGLLLCRLINLAAPDTIDERAINKKENLNIYQKTENINLALNAAKSIGCQVVNIGAQDIMEGRPILVLGLIWQIIKIQLLSQISLKNHPELTLLLEPGEDLHQFMNLPADMILLRWINYHLSAAGSARRISNFGADIVDSEIYGTLLSRLYAASGKGGYTPLPSTSDAKLKAANVINGARDLGAPTFIKPQDICEGNKKLNLSFVAQIFNACPGLTITEEEKASFDLSSLEIDDVGDSREERVFRMWMNSLNMEGVYINNLFDGVSDGVVLLKLLDSLQPGSVNWKRVTLDSASRFKKLENCNNVITIGKEMKLSLVNCGGVDILDGNKKIILAIIWQLLRKYSLQVLVTLAASEGVSDISDARVAQWANDKVRAAGKTTTMKDFKDKSTKNSLFFLDLVAAIEPRAVDFSVVTQGVTEEDLILNAKYAISCARKLGACVFLTPEDIIETKSKMLLTFVAALWTAEASRR